MAVVICPHGDAMCPCNEGDGGCLYEPVVIDGRISPASPFGAAKAAIDGLVDAGVLSEDGPDIVTMLAFNRPEVTGTDALRLLILPLPLAAAS